MLDQFVTRTIEIIKDSILIGKYTDQDRSGIYFNVFELRA